MASLQPVPLFVLSTEAALTRRSDEVEGTNDGTQQGSGEGSIALVGLAKHKRRLRDTMHPWVSTKSGQSRTVSRPGTQHPRRSTGSASEEFRKTSKHGPCHYLVGMKQIRQASSLHLESTIRVLYVLLGIYLPSTTIHRFTLDSMQSRSVCVFVIWHA